MNAYIALAVALAALVALAIYDNRPRYYSYDVAAPEPLAVTFEI